uniref:NTP_transf_2 domain-containing protein n=1 Tax=Macrostomum lignano TaxID=282301 RepID=A0A1I8FAS4_9PLAT
KSCASQENSRSQQLKKPTGTERAIPVWDHVHVESLGVCQQIVAHCAIMGFGGAHRYSTGAILPRARPRDVLALPTLQRQDPGIRHNRFIQRIMTMKSLRLLELPASSTRRHRRNDDHDECRDQADAKSNLPTEDPTKSRGREAELAGMWLGRRRYSKRILGLLARQPDASLAQRAGPELAKQVAAHLQRVAVHNGVTVAVLGGLSAARRSVSWTGRPDIVVGSAPAATELGWTSDPAGRARTLFAEMRALLERITPMPTTTIQRRLQPERPPCRPANVAILGHANFCPPTPERTGPGADPSCDNANAASWARTIGPLRWPNWSESNLVAAPQSPRPHAGVLRQQRHRSGGCCNRLLTLLPLSPTGAEGVGALPAQVRPNRSGQPQRPPQSPWCRLRRPARCADCCADSGRAAMATSTTPAKATIWRDVGAAQQEQLARLRPAVTAAHSIESEEHRLLRQHAKRLWFRTDSSRARARSRPARTGRSPGRRRRR